MWAFIYCQPGYDRFFFNVLLDGGEALRREVFYLAYHLHWSWESILNMNMLERRAYVGLLADQIQRENDEIEKMRRSLK